MKAFHNLLACTAILSSAWLGTPSSQAAGSSSLVIAEVYGGGGNSGSFYLNDFVVLFNRGTTAVDVNGWSVQYASAAGTSWQVTPLATNSTMVAPGAYFLVMEGAGASGTALPTADATGNIAMSATAGKVALRNVTNALSGAITTGMGANIIDFVGFGTATAFEGTGPAPGPANATAIDRGSQGCYDSDNNNADFLVASPNPRNSTSTTRDCNVVIPPSIVSISGSVTTNAGANASFTVTAAGDFPLSYYWYKETATATNLITTATNSTLTLVNVSATDTAGYQAVVSNISGLTATSDVVTLTVVDPVLLGQPLSSQTLAQGATASLVVTAAGTAPLGFQWYSGSPGSGAPLSDNGHITGSGTSNLVITNLTSADAITYYATISNSAGVVTSSAITLSVVTTGGTLAFWDFNAPFNTNAPASAAGRGTAAPLGGVTFFLLANPTDGFDGGSETGGNTIALGGQGYPSAPTGNKTAGVQFNVSTVGEKNVKISDDVRETPTASKYRRLQYTTNGVDFIDYPASAVYTKTNSVFVSENWDLTGFPGVSDNANFGIRFVAEFESTATYGVSNTTSYIAILGTYSTSGTISYDLVGITGDTIFGSATGPTVSPIVDQTFSAGNSGAVTVVASGVAPIVITARSLDGSIVSASVSGNMISLSPNGQGVAPILVTATDANGNTTTVSFKTTVTGLNVAPMVTGLYSTNVLPGVPITYAFTVSDDHTAPASLVLAVQSANSTLVPSSGLVLGGSGTNRTLTITPAAGLTGVAPITFTAADNDPNPLTNVVSFIVMVRPSTNILLIDNFDYDGSNAIDSVSGGLWQVHSGATGPVIVSGGVATLDGVHNTEDVNAKLIGQPYSTNSSVVFYTSFTVNYKTLPSETGSYFAHFRDENSGPATGYSDRVWASTANAATNSYRLGVGNGVEAANDSGQYPLDLQLSNNYVVVTRYVISNGLSTIWINPASENSQNVTATDMPTTNDSAPNAINVSSYGLRQSNADEGALTLDNLKIGLNFSDVVTVVPTAPSVAIAESGTNIVVTWPDPSYSLQSSTNAATGYTTISGATSPYTNTSSASATFYRLAK